MKQQKIRSFENTDYVLFGLNLHLKHGTPFLSLQYCLLTWTEKLLDKHKL